MASIEHAFEYALDTINRLLSIYEELDNDRYSGDDYVAEVDDFLKSWRPENYR